MKTKLLLILSLLFFNNLLADTVSITAKKVSLDKEKNISIFENDVVVKTRNKILKSDFAKYFRGDGFLILKKNISIIDEKNNVLQTEHAEFFEKDEILKTIGKTKVETIEKYTLTGEDLYINNKNNIIKSQKNLF